MLKHPKESNLVMLRVVLYHCHVCAESAIGSAGILSQLKPRRVSSFLRSSTSLPILTRFLWLPSQDTNLAIVRELLRSLCCRRYAIDCVDWASHEIIAFRHHGRSDPAVADVLNPDAVDVMCVNQCCLVLCTAVSCDVLTRS